MNKNGIIETLARDKVIETMAVNIAHSHMSQDLQDLVQMVYLVLLEYDEDKIVDLWEHNEMRFFIARIIVNQYRSKNSPFHINIRKFQELTENISGLDFIDE